MDTKVLANHAQPRLRGQSQPTLAYPLRQRRRGPQCLTMCSSGLDSESFFLEVSSRSSNGRSEYLNDSMLELRGS